MVKPDCWRYSASQISSFVSCPKQYWYNYISDREATKPEGKYRAMGSIVHETIEEVLNSDVDSTSQTALENALSEELSQRMRSEVEDLEDEAYECVEVAAKYISDRSDMDILDIEADETFYVSEYGINSNFRAIMDVCTDNKIIDWKTGTNIDPKKEKIQGGVYLAAYLNRYDRIPDSIDFVYLREREISRYDRVTDDGTVMWSEEKNVFWDEMLKHASSLDVAWENSNWPAMPGNSKCHFCDYQYYCSDSGVGAEEIEHWQYP